MFVYDESVQQGQGITMSSLNNRRKEKNIRLSPFLKWAGGKRWFVQNYSHLLPSTFNRYIEPFLGAGSVFFYLEPKRAIIGDTNSDLIAAYKGIKNDWRHLQHLLRSHQRRHSDLHYYEVRESIPDDPIERAARLIYLNRTCFNGIYRVNLNGEFNVPRGSKNDVLLADDDFEAAARILRRAQVRNADFEELIDLAEEGDLVFADPPYTVRHNINGFVKYNEKLFSWNDQERLAKALARAKARGVKVVATNADHISVRELYEVNGFHLLEVSRFSSISAKSSSRKRFDELVILTNHKGGRKLT
jgi:DNA adenine methylase